MLSAGPVDPWKPGARWRVLAGEGLHFHISDLLAVHSLTGCFPWEHLPGLSGTIPKCWNVGICVRFPPRRAQALSEGGGMTGLG